MPKAVPARKRRDPCRPRPPTFRQPRTRPLHLFLLTDLEGAGGVRNWSYAEGRYRDRGAERLLEEVRAALDAGRKGGALRFSVLDGHGVPALSRLRRKDVEVLRMRERPCPYGLTRRHDALLFVGQHAMAGTPDGHLSHTNNGITRRRTINGTVVGEIGQWVMLAGSLGVPVIFLSGDAAACREARTLVPAMETVAVKRGQSTTRATHLSRDTALRSIRAGVAAALAKLRAGMIAPFPMHGPVRVETELIPVRLVRQTSAYADRQVRGLTKISASLLRSEANTLATALHRLRQVQLWQTLSPAGPAEPRPRRRDPGH